MIKIDFDKTYELESVSSDREEGSFYSYDKQGNPVLINIRIRPVNSPALSDLYNLSFGPTDDEDEIDDLANLHHKELDRLFATIILFALAFLEQEPGATIGLDGSDDVRAYMYHRMFITNKDYLSSRLRTFGVDWFVRLLRSGEIECDEYNRLLFKPRTEPFDYQRPGRDLYRYYMFELKKQNANN